LRIAPVAARIGKAYGAARQEPGRASPWMGEEYEKMSEFNEAKQMSYAEIISAL
jgi:hypothetical protein